MTFVLFMKCQHKRLPQQSVSNCVKKFVRALASKASLFVKIESESNSLSIRAITTNDQDVRITLPEPISARSSDWVEIIGTPAGPDAIRAREVILFGGDQDLDVEGYNMMVQFWTHSQDIYRQG